MKDTDIAVYKSFLLKLSYGAPGWPVSRFRPGTLVFILPDFGRDTDDLDLRHDLAAREHSLLAAFILVMLLDRALENDGIALVNLRQSVRPGSRLPNEVMAFGVGKGIDRSGAPLRIEEAATIKCKSKLNLLPELTKELSLRHEARFVLFLQALDVLLQIVNVIGPVEHAVRQFTKYGHGLFFILKDNRVFGDLTVA